MERNATYLRESDLEMISNEEALNREESSFPGGTDITSIVDSLYSSLYQYAVGLAKSESDALDLVQQTFLTFGQRLDQIRDFSKTKSWLFTTLRRHFLLKIRRHKKHPEVQFLPDAHDFRVEDPEVWRSLDAGNVLDALSRVDEKYRVALELFYLNNLSYREMLMLSEYRSAQSCRGCPEAKRSLNRSSLTPHGIEGIQFPLIIWARK